MQLRPLILLVAAAASAALPAAATAQLIPLTTRKDHVFDPVSRILYITTTAGNVERYDTATQAFLSPWTIGGTLGGIDVTPDGATVLVADRTFDTTTDLGLVRRVNASTGAVTTLQFPIDGGQTSFSETGSWDLVAMSNHRAFFTTDFVGSALAPLHQLNLDTNEITNRNASVFTFNEINERTWLFRSHDRSAMLGLESNTSGGGIFAYDATSDTFPVSKDLGFFPGEPSRSIFHSDGMGAVSRDGQWMAVEVATSSISETWILPPNQSVIVARLPLIVGGLMFHPTADVLYGIDAAGDDVVMYDTNTWTEIGRIDAGTNLIVTSAFASGTTSFDSVRNILFVSVPNGILPIQLPAPPALPLPGDYNYNGSVGSEDYGVWLTKFGTASGLADGSRNGIIDAADFVVWRDRLNAASATSATRVPEPNALLIAMTAAIGASALRRCRNL